MSIPAAGRVYMNNETGNEIVVIDVAKHEVVARWPIAPGESAAGLAIDLKNHRLFIGAHNSKMLMMDSTSGKVLAEVPIGAGVDATWFDPGTAYAFSSCSTGTVTIAHEDSPDTLTVVQTLQTATGARTMALDPSTHRIYLAAAKYTPPPAGSANARPGDGAGVDAPEDLRVERKVIPRSANVISPPARRPAIHTRTAARGCPSRSSAARCA